jgi:hypothetical protein
MLLPNNTCSAVSTAPVTHRHLHVGTANTLKPLVSYGLASTTRRAQLKCNTEPRHCFTLFHFFVSCSNTSWSFPLGSNGNVLKAEAQIYLFIIIIIIYNKNM